MNRTRIPFNQPLLCGFFLGIVALLLVPVTGASTAALASSCGPWSITPSPSKDSMDILYGIAAISPQDVWAVGRYVDTQNEALIEHWNGTRWSIVNSPSLGSASSYLLGIAAVSATDVWAVGGSSSGTLIEHWDGTRWSLLPSPSAGALFGVALLSATNVWAVGANAGQTLIEHWNGTRWSIVPSPNPGAFGNGLASVTAISATNIWAVGSAATTQFGHQALVEHWNGTQWRVVKSPVVGQYPYELRAVSAVSANDIWATGDYTIAPGDIQLTLTEHWNGTQWRVIPSPSPTGDDGLFGVVALSTSDVWAVGDRSSADQNLVVRWNGTRWNIVPSPYRRGASSSLLAVAADSATGIWAAGFDINNRNFTYQTLIERDCSPGNG